MKVFLISFGFSHEEAPPADYQYDIRSLRNPHRKPEFRPLTGKHHRIQKDMMETQPFVEFINEVVAELRPLRREQVTVAIGCSKGRHRSVAAVELIADQLCRLGHETSVQHRDLPEEPA